MIGVTADSNIYVSAFQFRGTPLKLLTLAAERRIDLAVSGHIFEEVTRTLREKFEWPEDRLDSARRIIGRITRHVSPTQTVDVIKDDPDDNRILECAMEAGSAYIVTGDKDLHRLGQFREIRVVEVADILDIVQGSGWRSR